MSIFIEHKHNQAMLRVEVESVEKGKKCTVYHRCPDPAELTAAKIGKMSLTELEHIFAQLENDIRTGQQYLLNNFKYVPFCLCDWHKEEAYCDAGFKDRRTLMIVATELKKRMTTENAHSVAKLAERVDQRELRVNQLE